MLRTVILLRSDIVLRTVKSGFGLLSFCYKLKKRIEKTGDLWYTDYIKTVR